ncbi:MAG: hypothetical protein H7Y30_00625, partial [Pyrinomonadaceae bacterium]|nr:hypothetical protein [Pyrinomonadaceae bacterium]
MNERENISGAETEKREETAAAPPVEHALRARLRAVKSVTERRYLGRLVRELGMLQGDVARAALETSALIAGVSFRASLEFLRAAPEAARVLEAEELHSWGEMGRRLAMGDVETATAFFNDGVKQLQHVPPAVRALIFQVCARQMTLSSSVAMETFSRAPLLAQRIADKELLRSVFEVAAEIARRSARHSADFLDVTPNVTARMREFEKDEASVSRAAVNLSAAFAARAGGIAADAWTALPEATAGLSATQTLRLLQSAGEFLERGGGAALHVLRTGGDVLRAVPEAFDAWIALLWTISTHGNAALVAFVRVSPAFFQTLAADKNRKRAVELALRAIKATHEVALVDGEAALACFRSSLRALRGVSIEQFEEWARDGLKAAAASDARARRSYYALETRRSSEALHSGGRGLSLEEVQHTLKLYVEALTGRVVEVAPLAAVPDEARIGDGRTIHLPSMVAEFDDEELDFRLYKVLAAHAAGQIEFGTHDRESSDLRAAYAAIAEVYAEENADARDAFALVRAELYLACGMRGEDFVEPKI